MASNRGKYPQHYSISANLSETLTFAYFVPTNTAFASSQIKLNSVPAKLNEWLIIHAARIILAMAASVLAFIAIIQSMRG